MTPEGKTIRLARLSHGLTLEQVAAHLGVTRQAVWHWEQASRLTSNKLRKDLSELLGIKLPKFLPAVTPKDDSRPTRHWARQGEAYCSHPSPTSRLAAALQKRQLGLPGLATQLGVNESSVRSWWARDRVPPCHCVTASTLLGVSPCAECPGLDGSHEA